LADGAADGVAADLAALGEADVVGFVEAALEPHAADMASRVAANPNRPPRDTACHRDSIWTSTLKLDRRAAMRRRGPA
jgi:hypothetical protein